MSHEKECDCGGRGWQEAPKGMTGAYVYTLRGFIEGPRNRGREARWAPCPRCNPDGKKPAPK